MTIIERPSKRAHDALRSFEILPHFTKHAEGSCLVKSGDTHVLVTASVDERVPSFLRGKNEGWVTAEYGMLPRSTHSRMDREAARGKQSGRTLEIQRLIGRALRAVVDLSALGERQIKIDCDVLQADGGTRTASITGAWVDLAIAVESLMQKGLITTSPLTDQVAAISCGIYEGAPVLDLDYDEDSAAETDANFILTASGGMVEIQGTAEKTPFSRDELNAMMDLAEKGCNSLFQIQLDAFNKARG
jgi:ribonuclease PH